MAKCKSSPTSPRCFKVHCSLNLFFATFFSNWICYGSCWCFFQPFLHTWMLIAAPFKHLAFKLLLPFSPIFVWVYPNNVHLSSLCFCYSQSKVLHLTLCDGTCWKF
jgi:hypothetical protein